MSAFAVEYTYDPDRGEDMDRIRPGHRAFLRSLLEQGRLLASGPWVGEEPGALLLVLAEDEAAVEQLLDADPFQQAGLITGRRVRGWNPVIGPFAPDAA
ncbi:MAG TPA: hypothetical protein H9815_09305 [Candidatus Ruania gallistercoris]|uniref:YCII-related domain-containing protein n=1 Tax=Candidatus Ruania gallistercoris TaxID=2838746 RepID=A0A9D2J474_9MICO|nr:hypothetical protein [Candidatus Ruania gallistercoris]